MSITKNGDYLLFSYMQDNLHHNIAERSVSIMIIENMVRMERVIDGINIEQII